MSKKILDNLGFHPIVKRWFVQKFDSPSPPQKSGWPSIAAEQHTLILAPTGSGKTLAAFLWSIDRLFRMSLNSDPDLFSNNPAGVHTLYISPLKALNNDVRRNLMTPLDEIQQLARSDNIEASSVRVAIRTGDTPAHLRRSMLRKPPHILITTPESLYLLLGTDRGRELFRELNYVIVDEIHAISQNKRGVHLSLSLERMMPLVRKEPTRIGLSATQKPLDRIAAFLGGQTCCSKDGTCDPRPVQIIDCGQRKRMDLKVVTPVKSFNELPESSVWQPVYQHLYRLIRAHKTTLVFAGMRAQTEKIARALNQMERQVTGDPETEVALAHHGSISREARYSIESRLKSGDIPAVIATASLELGIDIGSIDLVVQLEAPRSVSGALQRVGRSGHLLSAISKGRIFVLYPGDLDDAVAIARCISRADIEKTRIPENALDVLAQQIVAEVAVQDWDYENLFELVRGSYCYRELPPMAFKSVIQMLCGRFAGIPLQALKPRLNWDRVNNRLTARRGSRLAALMNGGTIPDRGYYGVYLENANVRLGEVEEEFAFESRVGEVFFLGNSEWLIRQILQDRIIVSPVAAINPRAPFWKGGILHRNYSTSIKIGQFRGELIDKMDQGQAESWLVRDCLADEDSARNLVNYFARQRERGQKIATDRQIVAELTTDSGGQSLLMVHAPFGARVNGAWAIAIASALEQHCRTRFQYSFDDDGVLIRLPETIVPLPLKEILSQSTSDMEAHLIRALPESPVFLAHFRYNAARSLMLPRSQPGQRIPLWLQRLRAADLHQATAKHNDFPVMVETYRECLQDVFDLNTLKKIVGDIEKGRISISFVTTPIPSPMAAGIIFKFVSVYLYEEDQNRQPGADSNFSSEILDDMLDRRRIPALLSPDIVLQAEKRWQHLDPYFQAASAEELFNIIEKLAPVSEADLARRSKSDPALWLEELKAANRIIIAEPAAKESASRPVRLIDIRPMSSGDGPPTNTAERIQRYLLVRGPVSIRAIESELVLPHSLIAEELGRMLRDNQVVRGRLIEGLDEEQWCDRQNFTRLYRTAIARRREIQHPADRNTFNRFLIAWHGIAKPGQALPEVFKRYRGYRFPPLFFEREILSSRYHGSGNARSGDPQAEFEARISNGDIIVRGGRNGDTGRKYLAFQMRGEGSLFDEHQSLMDRADTLNASARIVFQFLQVNGASYGRDLAAGTELGSAVLQQSLNELAEKGLASCENYQAFLSTFQSRQNDSPRGPSTRIQSLRDTPPHGRRPGRLRSKSASRSELKQRLRLKSRMHDSRWFLTTSFAVMGKRLDKTRRIERQARLLLQRHGILIKEWYRREQGLIDWYHLFQALKRMEWQGEIRRGYFVAGLSGVQFALPEALDLLHRLNQTPVSGNREPVIISSLDPAQPFGGGIDWEFLDSRGEPLKVVRSASSHLVLVDGDTVMVSTNYFKGLTILKKIPRNTWKSITDWLKTYLKMPVPLKPANRIEIHRINDQPAATSPHAVSLLENGFEKEDSRLVLWPSAVR